MHVSTEPRSDAEISPIFLVGAQFFRGFRLLYGSDMKC